MRLDLRYLGRSEVTAAPGGGAALKFAPNLSRPRVAFDAEVRYPVRFREAISALHDVVVHDLRFVKKDKAAYKAWKQQRQRREHQEAVMVQQQRFDAELHEALGKMSLRQPPQGLVETFQAYHARYWKVRREWARELIRDDMEMFRHLVPCDPVVTVAPDTVYFECFAKDESSYGCLFVDRGAFHDEQGGTATGTTNVDYSLALYQHFQTLRSYRPTRLQVDPSGFEVQVESRGGYREEKIDLPASWLRGFGQLQAAMCLPSRAVRLPVEAVYSVLAWLERHREKRGPRCIRFELTPGEAPELVLEPWGKTIRCHGAAYRGERRETIKVWGRRRLTSLTRVLPLTDHVEVLLLGSGLPSVWIAHMDEMRFVLGLSGWTTNSWTGAAALDQLAGDLKVSPQVVARLERHLREAQLATLGELEAACVGEPRSSVLGSLHQLARRGQIVYDFVTSRYRYRQVMPYALSADLLGPEPPEVVASRELLGEVTLEVNTRKGDAQRLKGRVGGTSCEATLDGAGRFVKARCSCSFFYKNTLRQGPCRHLMALKAVGREL